VLLTRRAYYGWRMLVGLSVAETISWGILYYSFSVFIRPIEAELGWSRTEVTGAFSLALLVAGLAAIPVGHWLDAHGARGLMTAGSVIGALLFAALSRVTTLPALYGVWGGLGLAMAMVLYEPAFAVVATWFARHRDRALTILTVFGGLASTLLVPLATWLLQAQGWRGATLTLALILAGTTIPLHGLLLRRRPEDVGQRPDGDETAPAAAVAFEQGRRHRSGPLLSEAGFRALTVAFTLASLVGVATCVHLVPYLTDSGVSPAAAATVFGVLGLMQLPGRLVFGPIRRRFSWQSTTAIVLLAQAAALVILARSTSAFGLGAFACLFGAGSGIATLLRASTVAELYGTARYGRVSGVLALFNTMGRAAGPVMASVVYVAAGRYEWALGLLALILGAAASIVLLPWPVPAPRRPEPLAGPAA
jgi:MFS family permease